MMAQGAMRDQVLAARSVPVAEQGWRNGCVARGPAEDGVGRATAGRQTS